MINHIDDDKKDEAGSEHPDTTRPDSSHSAHPLTDEQAEVLNGSARPELVTSSQVDTITSQDALEIDPNEPELSSSFVSPEITTSKSTGLDFSFEDLVEGYTSDLDVPTFDDSFGAVPIKEFASEKLDFPPIPGVYVLELEATELQGLIDFTKLSVLDGTSDSSFSWLELTAKRRAVQGRTYDRSSFSIRSIRLFAETANLNDEQPQVFLVSHRVLAIAMRAAQTIVTLTYDVPNERLTFRSSRFQRPLVLKARNKFASPDARALGPERETPPRTVATADIKKALAFVAPFAPTDDVQAEMRTIEIGNGLAIAGNSSAIAQFASPAFKDGNFRLSQGHVARVQAALPNMSDSVEQTETEYYTRFSTETQVFGVARPDKSFPKFNPELPLDEPYELNVERKHLLYRLQGLKTAKNTDFFFQVRRSSGRFARAFLSTSKKNERSAMTAVNMHWCNHEIGPFTVRLPLDSVMSALAGFEGMFIFLRFHMKAKQLIVHGGIEDGPEKFVATRIGLLGRRGSGSNPPSIFRGSAS
jgi:hypothetical protein